VQREHVLGFLRVDVDAAGDDRERLAVGEEQEAVLVEVADVAEGGPVGVVPVWPAGSSVPSSAQIRTVPEMARPTVPGLVSQVALSIAVMPLPSVPA
jgi:hypothetical protein